MGKAANEIEETRKELAALMQSADGGMFRLLVARYDRMSKTDRARWVQQVRGAGR